MSRVEVVDAAYRLHPSDLQDGPWAVTISAISLQGLETVQPVAHFAETRKRLALTHDHCRTLILLTGSSLFQDWVGYTVRLTLDRRGPQVVVRILPPPDRFAAQRRRLTARVQSLLRTTRVQRDEFIARARTWLRAQRSEPVAEPHPLTRARQRWQWARWRPILVIGLLSVVSFFYARAYGMNLMQLAEVIFTGNGG